MTSARLERLRIRSRRLSRSADPRRDLEALRRVLPPQVPTQAARYLIEQGRAELAGGLVRLLGTSGPDPRLTLAGFNGPDGWRATWPAFADLLWVFGSDWLGNLWALDLRPESALGGAPTITVLDVGDGRLVPLFPSSLEDLLEFTAAEWGVLIQGDLWRAWRAAGGERPAFDQAVGSRCLGAATHPEDLELVSLIDYVAGRGAMAEPMPPGRSEGVERPRALVPPDVPDAELIARLGSELPVVLTDDEDGRWWRFWD